MLVDLLPGEVDLLFPRQCVEHSRLDRMHDFLRRAGGRYEIKPPPRREARLIEPENVFRDRVAATKTAEEPSVQLLTLKRGLDGIDQRVAHDSIIPSLRSSRRRGRIRSTVGAVQSNASRCDARDRALLVSIRNASNLQ